MEHLIILPGWIIKYIVDKEYPISQYYDIVVDILKKDFDVRIIEFPGFGTNPEPDKPWYLNDFVEYLNQYINDLASHLSSPAIHIVGHSFGGQIAAKFSYLHPEKVKKLVLYNAACIREKKLYGGVIRNMGTDIFRILPFFRWVFYRVFVGSTDYLKLPRIMQKTMSNILLEDLTDILPNIKSQTLVLWGSKDKFTPLNQGLKIKKLIPNSKITIHPGGHSFHLQDPKTFAEYVKNFLLS